MKLHQCRPGACVGKLVWLTGLAVHTRGYLVISCTVCVHWGVCNYYPHVPVIPLMSTFLHVRSVLCNTCASASIGGSAFPASGCVCRAAALCACFELTQVGRCSWRSFVVLVHMVRSCCLVSCLFSGRSAELLGTGTSPYAFVNFLSCRQSRVRHWPRYISYRLAFSWILLCSLVHLSQCIL